jgi:hypothetical protein
MTIKVHVEKMTATPFQMMCFYDYGIGETLEKALDDYITTIKERVEISKDCGDERRDGKLALLRKMLSK